MDKELLNKVKINFAYGKKEIELAKNNLGSFYDGKIRAIARRASGFYIEGLIKFHEKTNYGNSFMNHLKAISKDSSIPQDVKNAANFLTMKMTNENLSGTQAVEQAEVIINFCINEFEKFSK